MNVNKITSSLSAKYGAQMNLQGKELGGKRLLKYDYR